MCRNITMKQNAKMCRSWKQPETQWQNEIMQQQECTIVENNSG
jgi:hypothetical protein